MLPTVDRSIRLSTVASTVMTSRISRVWKKTAHIWASRLAMAILSGVSVRLWILNFLFLCTCHVRRSICPKVQGIYRQGHMLVNSCIGDFVAKPTPLPWESLTLSSRWTRIYLQKISFILFPHRSRMFPHLSSAKCSRRRRSRLT